MKDGNVPNEAGKAKTDSCHSVANLQQTQCPPPTLSPPPLSPSFSPLLPPPFFYTSYRFSTEYGTVLT